MMLKLRIHISLSILLTVLVGLVSRTTFALNFIPLGIGDFLYATLIYLSVLWLIPNKKPTVILCMSIALCFIIEISQLSTWTWLLNARDTTIGKLILGNDYRFSDLVYLTLGCFLGLIVDRTIIRNTATSNESE